MSDDAYTRNVRLLRFLLPMAAIALLLAVFLFPRTLLLRNIDLSGLIFDPAEGLRLKNPRFSGTTDAGQPFSIRSEWALPDAPDPTRITLGPLSGEIAVEPGQIVGVEAAGGEFRPKARQLAIEGGVTVTTTDGYRVTLDAAELDFEARTLQGSGPVSGQGVVGSIEAGSMRAARRPDGDYIWFENGVRVIVVPAAEAEAGAPDAGRSLP